MQQGLVEFTRAKSSRLVVKDAKGEHLRIISLNKLGYQFAKVETIDMPPKGGEIAPCWDELNSESPYLVKGWKVEEFLKTIHVESYVLRFVPDGKEKSIVWSQVSKSIECGGRPG